MTLSDGILPIAFNDNIPAFNGLPAIRSETQHINDVFGLATILVSSLRRGSKLYKEIVGRVLQEDVRRVEIVTKCALVQLGILDHKINFLLLVL